MFILDIRLINYIGIYNGIGLNEIYIDFRKCKNKIIVIKGDNGSGKTTLWNAINPLPDNNNSFIPNMKASKEMNLFYNNIIYNIKIIHDVKTNGERSTTKAYIYKMVNNIPLDMNPNGNVTSFKDILYEEFKLDPNFIALSQMSSDDRGIADKAPAERKRFINSRIETLEVYNNIYKILSKKSNTLKSMINSLCIKISSLGQIELLESNLININNNLSLLDKELNKIINDKATAIANINVLDPDSSIQMRYTKLSNELNIIISNTKNIDKEFNILLNTNPQDIINELNITQKRLNEINIEIQILQNNINLNISNREDDHRKLNNKINKLESMDEYLPREEMVSKINNIEDLLKYCENEFIKFGINDINAISKEEYILALNTLKTIKSIIDSFLSDTDYTYLQEALEAVKNNIINNYNVLDIQLSIGQLNNKLSNIDKMISDINTRNNILDKLNRRPDDCVRDDCGFVNDIISSISHIPDTDIRKLENERKSIINELHNAQKRSTRASNINEYILKIKEIINIIDSNRYTLQKINSRVLYMDSINLIYDFIGGKSFQYIDELYSYIDKSDLIEEYKYNLSIMNEYKSQLNIIDSKSTILLEINKDIEELQLSLNDTTKILEDNNLLLNKLKTEQMELSSKEGKLIILNEMYNKKINLSNESILIQNEINKLIGDMDKINECMNVVNKSTENENKIRSDLNRLNNEKESINYKINTYNNYNNELLEFQNNYNLIERIKYYSSPTTGIQLVFMELYMSKIIQLANQLLSNLFEGRFIIQPFVITENDFRIPVLGNGFPNDDITSLSNGEKAMIGMVLSIAIRYHSSDIYNIFKVDEIDSSLDTVNRAQFFITIDKIMTMLNSQQCFMISHNIEMNMNNVDLIVLKDTSGEVYNNNVIFRY